MVLERGRIGNTWRGRWDSFCLVTPNWTMDLPGFPYDGDDPQGFVLATRSSPTWSGTRLLSRPRSRPASRSIAWTRPRAADSCSRPRPARCAPARWCWQPAPISGLTVRPWPRCSLLGFWSSTPRTTQTPAPYHLDGSSWSEAARPAASSPKTSTWRAARCPWPAAELPGRRARLAGLDTVDWLHRTTWFDLPLSALPSPQARLAANVQFTGRDGGHDLNYRVLQAMGVSLLGHLQAVAGSRARFAPDLADSVAFGDQRYGDICTLLREQLPAGLRGSRAAGATSVRGGSAAGRRPEQLRDGDLHRRLSARLRAVGPLPGLRSRGFPLTEDGASTVVPGLYFLGVHFLRTRRSSLLFGVGEDAAHVARSLVRHR